MKSLLVSMTLLTLVSCGSKHETKTVMMENPFDNSNNEARFTDIESRLLVLENKVSANVNAMSNLEQSLNDLDSELEQLETDLNEVDQTQQDALNVLIASNQVEHNNLLAMVNGLQGQTNSALTQLVALSNNVSIVAFYDPCGDKANAYDEILMKTNTGDYIAYFESGSNRFLTKLDKNVLYQTTDTQVCKFKIDNSNNIILM